MSDQLAAETENKRDCIISGDNKVTIENGSLNALNPGARYRLRNEGATADWANHGLGQWEYWTIRKIGGEGCIQSGDWVYFESHRDGKGLALKQNGDTEIRNLPHTTNRGLGNMQNERLAFQLWIRKVPNGKHWPNLRPTDSDDPYLYTNVFDIWNPTGGWLSGKDNGHAFGSNNPEWYQQRGLPVGLNLDGKNVEDWMKGHRNTELFVMRRAW